MRWQHRVNNETRNLVERVWGAEDAREMVVDELGEIGCEGAVRVCPEVAEGGIGVAEGIDTVSRHHF